MKALVIKIRDAAAENIELASDQLWQLGVRAIEERSVEAGIELWTVVGESTEAVARVAVQLDSRWEWRLEDVDPEPCETWRQFAEPIWVKSDMVIVPAWQEHSFEGDPLVLQIEPGAAFGLGDHPTTELSLRALATLLQNDSEQPLSVLDVGCGTGVLAIAAARLGAAPVRAVDIASAAVEATLDNAERNDVQGQIAIDTTDIVDLDGAYDIVVANILAPVLVNLADDLRRLTAPGGRLVISGILAESHAHVLEALAPMKVVHSECLGEWVAVTLSH